ncbi:MAG: response regulator [Ferrovum sp.]|nr:response regulator [Ferrovum sp.]NDU86564.1 response regulator [Ferrovum sp.]
MFNIRSTVLPVVLVSMLIMWTLFNGKNALPLGFWCLIVILSHLNLYRYARHFLNSGIPSGQAFKIVLVLMLMLGIDGALWGSLAWITLDTNTLAGSILVVASIAAMAGGAVSSLSPVFTVFIAYVIPELTALASKMWSMGDPAFNALGVAGLLYVAALLGQTLNGYRATRASIELRFDNAALVNELRLETMGAEKARQEAEQANTAKSKFLAAASHDLRQPIHALGLFLGVLANSELNITQRDVVTNANAAVEASTEMLSTLLDFSRIEAGAIIPVVKVFPIQPLLNKIEREFESQADAKGITYRSRESDLAVYSDPVLVELILRNLVSNAIRYTEYGGILVSCRKRGDHVNLEVWDTGIGIAPEHHQMIFKEFHQLGNPERDQRKGLGLGLAIADGLARTLDHKLTLASIPQRGSVFRISLPLVINAVFPANNTTMVRTSGLKNIRVLLVEDNERVSSAMVNLLRDWGCICDAAEYIEEAVCLAQSHAPNLIICDYRLRDQRTGLQAIATLRELLGNTLPALLITGDTAPERLREEQSSGIPLLHKPVAPNLLYQKMVAVLEDRNSGEGESNSDAASVEATGSLGSDFCMTT